MKTKERKLELADIAGYLPYGLKVQIHDYDDYVYYAVEECDYQYEDISINAFKVYGITTDGYVKLSNDLLSGNAYDLHSLKPILRPMSDMIKPMTHPDINNGEEFVPKNYMSDNLIADAAIGDTVSFYYHYMKGLQSEQYYSDWNIVLSFLSKLQFDYNDLIGQGLAIDINTIKE